MRRGGKLIRGFHPRSKAESMKAQNLVGPARWRDDFLGRGLQQSNGRVAACHREGGGGAAIWESAAYTGSLRGCLPLVRLGFDAPRPKDLDISLQSRRASRGWGAATARGEELYGCLGPQGSEGRRRHPCAVQRHLHRRGGLQGTISA